MGGVSSVAVPFRTGYGAAAMQHVAHMPETQARTKARRKLTGSRAWTITIPDVLLDHLDEQARRRCCSRSAYLRLLIVRDLERGESC